MRYTAVFDFPDGEEPSVGKSATWLGGAICAVQFSDALDELQRLREAAQNYCDHYLRDELDEPELCYDEKHREIVVALWDALTPNVEVTGAARLYRTASGGPPSWAFRATDVEENLVCRQDTDLL